MASRGCKLNPDSFCYVCGLYISSKQVHCKIQVDAKYAHAYQHYFGIAIGDQEKTWAPHVICGTCRSRLEDWLRGGRKVMPFAIPRIWREPRNHVDDCYFCMVDISSFRRTRHRNDINYPDIPSSIAPVDHSDDLPVPKPPQSSESRSVSPIPPEDERDSNFEGILSSEPHFPNQKEMDDLVRDLGLTKSNAELLFSRLKQWNLLDKDCRSTSARRRHEKFAQFFDMKDSLCFCTDVHALFKALDIIHDPEEWRLFIDSSSRSLKCVLLHNGNVHPSIPIGHSVHLKEDYANVKFLLECINYNRYQWTICGDFKMIGFLRGLQGGYTKHSCFLCLWDSRAKDQFSKRIWEERTQIIPGRQNVKHPPLVPSDKILMPPLHIKLGLAKQFVKALDVDGPTFLFIRSMFPHLSMAKVQGGIFTGPQVRKMLLSRELESSMLVQEKRSWRAFRCVVENFLGNRRADNYQDLVNRMVVEFEKMGCRMSLKVHVLFSHLDFFSSNLGDVSEEHGERFHQDIAIMEKRYQGHWDANMMGDYIWGLVRDCKDDHKRRARKSIHF